MCDLKMLKTNKVLQIKTSHGQSLRVVREHYIREDVPCYSEMCIADCANIIGGRCVSLLPNDVTHYVVPDCEVARLYLEVFEIEELTGIIFLQTVVNSVQHEGSRKLHRRIMNLVRNPNKRSVVFHNEYQKYAYCTRGPGETLQNWQARSVYEGAVWYHNHLAAQLPIVIITENESMIKTYGSRTNGVYAISFQQYINTFLKDLDHVQNLYQSLTQAIASSKSKVEEMSDYLPSDVLEAGLLKGHFMQGRLTVNKHQPQKEAFVTPSGVKDKKSGYESDILISGSVSRNRAVHGDAVVVELLPRSQWMGRSLALTPAVSEEETGDTTDAVSVMPTGRIVGILQRNWCDYVCSFCVNEESQRKAGKVLVIPWDRRIPKIRISTTQVNTLRDHRILVRIDSWEAESQYPNGHFVRSLGKIGDLETEITAILIHHHISNATPFSEAQLKELPVDTWDNPWSVDPEEVSIRRDLRQSHLVFSIDPKGCEDVDDTLSVRKLDNGHLELGVHIADVTFFVPVNSLTDLEARSRSTTVYLADRRYDMLPEVLSAGLCSLLGGVDRYAMSVIWELDEKYEVVDVWYGRTVINSQYKLFYEIAQQMYDGAPTEVLVENIPELQGLDKEKLDQKVEELRSAVGMLIDISRRLNAKRTSGGALVLEGVEVQVQFADRKNKTIEDLIPKQSMEIHETIAECMIFANHWVAKKICQAFPSQALLRHHPLPRQEHFETLIQCAKSKGFEIATHSNKALADSLDACVDPDDPLLNKLLRSMATQAMSNASYFSTGSLAREQFFHYGLALDYYTHFTSPIRRYADIVVHRLLLAALHQEDINKLPGNKELNELSEHINNKHREAQHAQKESLELFQTLFFLGLPEDDDTCLADAVIFQLRTNGLLVFLPRFGVKGAAYLRSKEGQVLYIASPFHPEWTSGSLSFGTSSINVNSVLGTQTYNLFDHVTVRISVTRGFAHPSTIHLHVVTKELYTGSTWQTIHDPNSAKSHIIQTVTAAATEGGRAMEKADLLALGANFPELKAQYGQSEDKDSLYVLFQAFRDQSMLDV